MRNIEYLVLEIRKKRLSLDDIKNHTMTEVTTAIKFQKIMELVEMAQKPESKPIRDYLRRKATTELGKIFTGIIDPEDPNQIKLPLNDKKDGTQKA